MYNVLFILRLS